tara:strand:- start:864 stop:1907 length:1044 start_codon:yes stop_codon:yes gene_type:complete
MQSSEIIKQFLLERKGYLKKGNQKIQDTLTKKYQTHFSIDEIRSIKKEVLKNLRESRKLEAVVEDFRENSKRLESTPFAPTRKAPIVALSKNIPPSIADQEGMHIMMGCNHVPFHHKRLHDGIRRMMIDHASKIVGFHLMGDFADINTLSSHDKGRFTAVPGLTLDDEYAACNDELDMFAQAMNPNVWKTYLYGNHEDRHNRWMANMDNAKTPLTAPREGLDLVQRGYDVKNKWSQDYFTLGNDFEIFHGIYFSIHNAKAHLDKLRTSCAYVHTHRIQNYREGRMAAFNIGACADFTTPAFNYATRPMKAQWANGFAINMIDWKGNSNITQINVNPDGHFWFGGVYY